jgi:isopropylmalate/homocitrate/citramalate synthase
MKLASPDRWPLQFSPPTGKKRYQLVDHEEPNLIRELFPYAKPPRVAFDGQTVPMDPSEEIFLTDTTFRDGQQAREPYSVPQIVELYKLLARLGGPHGIIRKSEFFLYTHKDREAVLKVLELDYEYPQVTGWIRAQIKDFELVKQMGLKETGILTSLSDYHIYHKLKKTRTQAVEGYLQVVDAALENGIIPRCHFEDATRADFWEVTIPFAQMLVERAQQAKIPVLIRFPDTMGFGVPWAEASLPRSIPKLVYYLHHEAGVPKEWLEAHCHHDFYMVLANAVAAWLYGAAANNGTLLGIGERTGNTPLEALVIWYVMLTGDDSPDLSAITDIKEYYERELGEQTPPRQPFVGERFNITQAGIHADGLMKDEEIYNIFDTTKLLRRPPGVMITDKTGAAGLTLWIGRYIGRDLVGEIDKRDSRIQQMEQEILAEYEHGRVSAMSNEEIVRLFKKHFAEEWNEEVAQRLRQRGVRLES